MIQRAGLRAVEVWTDDSVLRRAEEVIRLCRRFDFRYAVHAPTDGFNPRALAGLAEGIKAEVTVCHNIYWEDEWRELSLAFRDLPAKLCVENVFAPIEVTRVMRRFELGLCLDLEHIQLQANGVFEEGYLPVMRRASHVHMSGYYFGSEKWHTHLHHSPGHSRRLLDLLRAAEYSGLVVSEARVSLQTEEEFRALSRFAGDWAAGL